MKIIFLLRFFSLHSLYLTFMLFLWKNKILLLFRLARPVAWISLQQYSQTELQQSIQASCFADCAQMFLSKPVSKTKLFNCRSSSKHNLNVSYNTHKLEYFEPFFFFAIAENTPVCFYQYAFQPSLQEFISSFLVILIESWNYRITKVGKGLQDHPAQPSTYHQ